MTTKRKRGRPSRWDATIAVKLGLAIGRGQKFEQACRTAGLPVSTAYRLLAAARAGDGRYAGLLEATKPPEKLSFAGFEALFGRRMSF